MVKISALYPNTTSGHFDMEYYLHNHIPLCIRLFSEHHGYHGVSAEKGIGAVSPGTDAPYLASAHFLFNSLEDFQAAFAAHAAALAADVPNYTDIAPVFQLSEVLLSA